MKKLSIALCALGIMCGIWGGRAAQAQASCTTVTDPTVSDSTGTYDRSVKTEIKGTATCGTPCKTCPSDDSESTTANVPVTITDVEKWTQSGKFALNIDAMFVKLKAFSFDTGKSYEHDITYNWGPVTLAVGTVPVGKRAYNWALKVTTTEVESRHEAGNTTNYTRNHISFSATSTSGTCDYTQTLDACNPVPVGPLCPAM